MPDAPKTFPIRCAEIDGVAFLNRDDLVRALLSAAQTSEGVQSATYTAFAATLMNIKGLG